MLLMQPLQNANRSTNNTKSSYKDVVLYSCYVKRET